jgi:hypothetical protein
MVGDQTLLAVFEFLLYNQICSSVKLPPELHVLNILQHLHLLSPGHVSQYLVVSLLFYVGEAGLQASEDSLGHTVCWLASWHVSQASLGWVGLLPLGLRV